MPGLEHRRRASGSMASRNARSFARRGWALRSASRRASRHPEPVSSSVVLTFGAPGIGICQYEREVVGRPPVEDLLDDGVLAVDAMVRRPDAAATARRRLLDDLGDARLPAEAAGRRSHVFPGDGRRRRQVVLDGRDGGLRLDVRHASALMLGRAMRPRGRATQPVDLARDGRTPRDARSSPSAAGSSIPAAREAVLRVQRVGAEPGRLGDARS